MLGRAAHGARLAGHEPLRQFGGGLLVPGTQQTDVPFGGRKQSGLGVEFGTDGLNAFTDIQVINISKV